MDNVLNESGITRRGFAASMGASVLAAGKSRPNILWITCEDIGPQLGCYGDTYADTPNLDKLASRGMMYRHAWSNAPVCAPARTTIISGMYPTSTGSEHMRSMTRMPAGTLMYPQYLREAGYYASNNVKEDYNLEKPGKVWDDSSKTAHWRNRPAGKPFFAIFNLVITHESQIRTRPHKFVHDPAKARMPAYHPDTPEVRKDWAQYYDNITTMDGQAGRILRDLEHDGLADSTIVFFYGDHGSGMPRSKRWPYNSGLQVPLIVYIPEEFRRLAPKDYRAAGTTDRLVGFVDLAPTLLSLAGVKAPSHLRGHAFLGEYQTPDPSYLYGFRGRMDERYDLVRSVRDKRYVYVRNYMPHKPYGQHVAYMFETPTTAVWKRLYDEGKLRPPKTYFWETKPPEELYDLQSDRDEVNNLAKSAQHQDVLKRMRKAEQDWVLDVRDVGFLPENEIHERAKGSSPYEVGHDERRYPLKRIFATAETASSLKPNAVSALLKAMRDEDSAVRYWAALGILMRGAPAVKEAHSALGEALADRAPAVRVAAAEALGRYGDEQDVAKSLAALLELSDASKSGAYVAMMALNAVETLGAKAKPIKEKVLALPVEDPNAPERVRSEYIKRLLESIGRI